ncbi:MAG: FmdB family zinc ribbon protein [Solirubrobacteraceae bacterium]
MPIYEYRCEQGHTFEVIRRMTDGPIVSCETCSAPVERVFTPFAVHFKGTGFYSTDYGSKNRAREKEAAEGAAKKAKAAESSGGDSKGAKDTKTSDSSSSTGSETKSSSSESSKSSKSSKSEATTSSSSSSKSSSSD